MPRRPPLVALAPVLALALTACTSGGSSGAGGQGDGVAVAPVNGSSSETLLSCRALKNLVPREISKGVAQRLATPLSDTTVAWGDPAITSRCGLPAGSPDDEPFTVNDVMWTVHDTGTSHTWTTIGRKVNVAILFPDSYENQGELIAALTDAVKTALKKK